MKRLICHSERSEESLTNVRPTYVGDPSLVAQDDKIKLQDDKIELQDDRKERGFTLAEILVVMAIVAIVGMIMVLIFANTLRGSNKSQILSVMKQNGQAVLDNIDRTIRSSDNIICPSYAGLTDTTSSSDTMAVVRNGTYTRYRFMSPPPSENGLIQQDIPIKAIEETDAEFISRICGSSDPMIQQPVILTDTNIQTGVSVENGSFARNRSAGFKDQVTVKFDLKPGVGAPQIIASQIDPQTYQTTIELR